ncbi:hypothetical protein [Solitalea canadensis]|uniref:Lipoprotein n=1 Tax=Solitalea canadensis (strain ATCC 29591 / DSM 3403 / JCM 21819 / LMG 8368 / NBRC 15130 / NCIMB 12057 / USAM 9D) TaxID=929556 RepID=H8KX87_SOLCM|nr:hypothetical protein [Solitalea canadensis]AFD08416.1 hypothetical protein Solca_3409 [Solitalea canadensis DSM 3403]
MKLKAVMALMAIGGLIAVGMYSCQKSESDVKEKPKSVSCANYKDTGTEGVINPCSTPQEYPLYAGNPANNPEDKLIGSIKVFRDENYLYVQYSVNKEGWSLHLTHTYVGPCDEVPSTRGGATPGQFDKTEWGVATEQPDCGVTCWVEKFPLSKFAGLECICILTHAEAWKDCKPAETAWGGNEEFPGNNWGRYISCFQIPDCGNGND